MKDWTGNKKSAFTTIGAAGHANHVRQSEDYYATEPKATELLCELEQFSHDVWEPACGEGHMVKVLQIDILPPLKRVGFLDTSV